jgi:hypothetical protein
VRDLVERLMAAAPGAKRHYLSHTDWLDDVDPEELGALYEEYSVKFRSALGDLRSFLGSPDKSLPADRDWFHEWYPEALEGAAWLKGGRCVCLSVEHQDRETPVGLALQCLTDDELRDLRG